MKQVYPVRWECAPLRVAVARISSGRRQVNRVADAARDWKILNSSTHALGRGAAFADSLGEDFEGFDRVVPIDAGVGDGLASG